MPRSSNMQTATGAASSLSHTPPANAGTRALDIPLHRLAVSRLNARSATPSTAHPHNRADDVRDNDEAAPIESAESLAALKASIAAEGVLSPLLVAGPDAKGRYEVLDGGRRLQALSELYGERGEAAAPCRIVAAAGDDDERKRSAALASNVVRMPLHPVDQFEAFAGLRKAGLDESAIAARYGLSVRSVRQRLALGALAPEIRAAWRKGAIDTAAAQAFTLEPDPAAQAKAFRALTKEQRGRGGVGGWDVRTALVGDRREAGGLLTLVGREPYLARGGRILGDLFGETDYVSDRTLLDAMIAEKVEAECVRLRGEGWGFADPSAKHPDRWSYRVETRVKKAERGRYGAIVVVNPRKGALEVKTGYALPKKGKAAKTKKSGANATGADAAATLPAALHYDVTRQMTWAAQDALAATPETALRLLLAHLEADKRHVGYGSPFKVSLSGLRAPAADAEPSTPHDHDEAPDEVNRASRDDDAGGVLTLYQSRLGETFEAVTARLATEIARAIDLSSHSVAADAPRAFLRVLEERSGQLGHALRSRFDAEDFFKRAGKAASVAALVDIDAATDARALAKKTAGELAAMAATAARAAGWLPAPMRFAEKAATTNAPDGGPAGGGTEKRRGRTKKGAQ